MEIPGYTYIAHKLVLRPWGAECRFTVKEGDNPDINEAITIPGMDIKEKDLVSLISRRLQSIKDFVEPPLSIDPMEKRVAELEKQVVSLKAENEALIAETEVK